MKTKIISYLIAISIFSLTLASLALAEYASTRAYFNVPATTTFRIAMPDNYSGSINFSITGTSEPSATATDYIVFNFTSIPQSALQQPSAAGNISRNQTNISFPIFLIYNTGNVNLTMTMYTNESIPANLFFWWNASTTPTSGCGTTNSTPNQLTTTSQIIIGIGGGGTNKLAPTCKLNVTLYANTSAGVSGGQLTTNLITNSST